MRPFASGPRGPLNPATPRHPRDVAVWDPLVRVLHWALAGLVFTAFLTSDTRPLHMAIGYTAFALAALRTAWGFVGPRHARFSDFVRAPAATLRYLAALARGRAPRHLGHNPAGGAMIMALLTLVVLAGASGWLSQTNAYFGILWVEDVHAFAGNGVIFLAIFHVAGVVASSLLHRENLVRAMFTGRKPLVSGTGELPMELPIELAPEPAPEPAGQRDDERGTPALARFHPR
jgi:cytochrome b